MKVRHKRSYIVWFHLCEMTERANAQRKQISGGLSLESGRRGHEYWVNSIFSQVVHENVLKLTVMVVQFCDYIKNNWMVHSKEMNCMVHKLYLKAIYINKAIYITTYIQILRLAEQHYILHIQTHTWKHAGQVGFQKYWKTCTDSSESKPGFTQQGTCGEHPANRWERQMPKFRQQSPPCGEGWVGHWRGDHTVLNCSFKRKLPSKQHKMSRSHQRWLVSTRTSIVWFPVFFCMLQRCHSFKNCTFLGLSC